MTPKKTSSSVFKGKNMTNNTTNNISFSTLDCTATRVQMYRWLSTLFASEIDQETLDGYRKGPGKVFLKKIATIPALKGETKVVQDLLEQTEDTADHALELAGAYGYLFLGAGGAQSVSPYESVYTSKSGSMFQQAEQHMRMILKEYGLGVSRDVCEPADHIAIELEFMAQLASMSLEAEATNAERAAALTMQQKSFLENHLLNWVPAFSANCVEQDFSGFYAALSQLMVTILKETHIYLSK